MDLPAQSDLHPVQRYALRPSADWRRCRYRSRTMRKRVSVLSRGTTLKSRSSDQRKEGILEAELEKLTDALDGSSSAPRSRTKEALEGVRDRQPPADDLPQHVGADAPSRANGPGRPAVTGQGFLLDLDRHQSWLDIQGDILKTRIGDSRELGLARSTTSRRSYSRERTAGLSTSAHESASAYEAGATAHRRPRHQVPGRQRVVEAALRCTPLEPARKTRRARAVLTRRASIQQYTDEVWSSRR